MVLNIAPRLPWLPALKDREIAFKGGCAAWASSRFNLDADASTAGCMDPMETFQVVSAWLCGVAMSQPLQVQSRSNRVTVTV
ncbi:hypothetical protein SCLCIDRAFT_30072 [Scleroderma citrinum Foug A]|uniref:Uncharacterized protein n=1 Tax=Scleroderma citrinum Foug A TaxID=1036808 RepID=A0A0C3DIB6_9AGAM|nr:hypothetical protein SCLCIDRAFT_30072 [Scleroderma citrinum Foug A]